MKEFRPNKPSQPPKKLKPSKFFDNFIQLKGPNGVLRASTAEIQKNLRYFFLDLIYGNVVQDKYLPFLMSGDDRVVTEAITEAQNKLMEFTILTQSMDCAAMSSNPVSLQPVFPVIYNNYMYKCNAYFIILNGLQGFLMTHDISYLTAISAKLNASSIRGGKQQIVL